MALLIRAELQFNKRQIYLFKPVATILVIALALGASEASGYRYWVLLGLTLSLGGDIALMFQENRKPFLIGLVLFLLGHVAYTIAKYGMSMCTIGFANEFAADGIAANSLWPRTIIATAAVQNLLGGDEAMRRSRRPEILADAAYEILKLDSRENTGNFYIDDEVLASVGITDLSGYSYGEDAELQRDIFLDE